MKARPNSLRQRLTSGSPAGNRELSFEAVDNDFPVDRLAAEGELSTEEKSVGRAEGAAGSVSRKLRPTARRQPFPVPGQPSATPVVLFPWLSQPQAREQEEIPES